MNREKLLADLRYELDYQQSNGIHTWGPGTCGHNARGSGRCAACIEKLMKEIERNV